jgi:hypothetical protein
MDNFKPLELCDRDLLLKYLGKHDFKTYEYSFNTLYLWRKLCNVEYAIIEDALVIGKTESKTGSFFMQPVGYRDECLKDIVLKLDIIKQKHSNMKHLFRDIEEPFLDKLRRCFGSNLEIIEDVNCFDYIYDSKQLISLPGKKFHGKKGHYNHFIRNYNYVIKDLRDEGVAKDCLRFEQDWYESREGTSEQLRYEREGINDIIANMDFLGVKGMAVYVNDRIAGFTIGEKAYDSMAIIHVEKGDADYNGIYAFINKEFVERYFSDVPFINREEDLGIEGLRKAKASYNPVKLEKKYIVDLI